MTVQLRRARAGDGWAREQIIGDYAPFARAAARRTVGRYVGPDDDLASIALMALDEAIDACGEERFAEEIPMSSLADEGMGKAGVVMGRIAARG